MNETELLAILARGEDSHHQFKRDFSNIDALAAELIAFANTGGGQLFIGVADDGQVSGLAAADVARLINYYRMQPRKVSAHPLIHYRQISRLNMAW